MKKIILIIGIVFTSVTMFAQEKGLHLSLSGNAAATKFLYDLDKYDLDGSKSLFGLNRRGKCSFGYGLGLDAQYYFNEYLGLSLGLDWSVFKTKSYFPNRSFKIPSVLDIDGALCDITAIFWDRVEKQTTHYLDIPLKFRYQYKWGRKEMHGFYLGAGFKLQLPLTSRYEKAAGQLQVIAEYPQWGITWGDTIGMESYGYGFSKEKAWTGKNHLKLGLSVVGEAGFLIGLSRRVDLTLGVSAEYGLLNIKKQGDPLLSDNGKTPQPQPKEGVKLGDFINHIGVVNSNQTSAAIHPLAIKANVGIRIKIGKLKERLIDERKISSESMLNDTTILREILDYLKKMENRHPDTIIINPIIQSNYYPNGRDMRPSPYGHPDVEVEVSPYYGGVRAAGTENPHPQDEKWLLEPIYFDLDKYDLRIESIEILNRKVTLMNKYPKAVLFVIGHTCDLASDPYNDKLSLRRAEAARNYIISKGIDPKRIEVVPLGKKDPSYPNLSEDLRKMNRRDDFYLFMKQ